MFNCASASLETMMNCNKLNRTESSLLKCHVSEINSTIYAVCISVDCDGETRFFVLQVIRKFPSKQQNRGGTYNV